MNYIKKTAILLILLFSVSLFISQTLFAQEKYALVIGNSNYSGISRLNNPVNDANDMEAVLKDLGFTVDKVVDGNLEQIENSVMNLRRKLGASRNTYGFFFYAGHGVQANGENYIIPIEANNILNETHLRQRAVSLQFILDSLNDAGNELNMIVLDACRDNPFGWSRSGSRGLTVVSRAPSGSIVMYATGADSVAEDGSGRNGLFTSYLLTNLRTPGLSVFDVFDRTMDDVIRATNGKQHPELSLRYPGAARAFLGSRPVEPDPTPQPQPVPAVVPPQPTPTPAVVPPQPAPTPAPQPTPAVVERLTPTEMARINGGSFRMGSSVYETGRSSNEGTQRQVTISGFYMGKYEVTQKEYLEVMGVNPSSFKGDDLPVEQVSWFDAIEYCNKRSQREGLTPAYTVNGTTVTWNRNADGYRLPTEAEWEYACRAGTTSPYNTGTYVSDSTGWYSANSSNRTHPVGQKAANAWGLQDMHGNVAEWCWDWYGNYASGTQTDPQGATSGSNRVSRGGDWRSTASSVRSAYRHNVSPSNKSNTQGFRIVRNAL